ncbi:hypothetical protein AAC387_Pa11g0523 [Persea americana]
MEFQLLGKEERFELFASAAFEEKGGETKGISNNSSHVIQSPTKCKWDWYCPYSRYAFFYMMAERGPHASSRSFGFSSCNSRGLKCLEVV